MNRKRKNKLTNGHGGVIIQLRAAIFERIRNAQIKAVQTVSISLLSVTFSCFSRLWFKRCCCDVVYNDVTRDSIACSLTLRHVIENRYVFTRTQNSWRYESIVLTNRIAGKRMNIKKIKLLKCDKFIYGNWKAMHLKTAYIWCCTFMSARQDGPSNSWSVSARCPSFYSSIAVGTRTQDPPFESPTDFSLSQQLGWV